MSKGCLNILQESPRNGGSCTDFVTKSDLDFQDADDQASWVLLSGQLDSLLDVVAEVKQVLGDGGTHPLEGYIKSHSQ